MIPPRGGPAGHSGSRPPQSRGATAAARCWRGAARLAAFRPPSPGGPAGGHAPPGPGTRHVEHRDMPTDHGRQGVDDGEPRRRHPRASPFTRSCHSIVSGHGGRKGTGRRSAPPASSAPSPDSSRSASCSPRRHDLRPARHGAAAGPAPARGPRRPPSSWAPSTPRRRFSGSPARPRRAPDSADSGRGPTADSSGQHEGAGPGALPGPAPRPSPSRPRGVRRRRPRPPDRPRRRPAAGSGRWPA